MTESALKHAIRKLMEDMSSDILEERAVNYIIKEVHKGRSLTSVINDAYIKNRLDEEKMEHVLENDQVIKAVEDELKNAFEQKDFRFSDE